MIRLGNLHCLTDAEWEDLLYHLDQCNKNCPIAAELRRADKQSATGQKEESDATGADVNRKSVPGNHPEV